MSETPDPILLEPGELIPDDLPPGTPVFLKLGEAQEPLEIGTELPGGGIVAPAFSDGCLGQHYPGTNPSCTES